MNDTSNNSTNILVVEDQKQIAFLIGCILNKYGYQHKHALNGQEALQLLLDGFTPELILLDIMMPVMGGYEFLDEVKSVESLNSIPVVILSALDDAHDVAKAVKKGAVDYCTKPIDPNDLLTTIRRQLK